jgi:hypothetical protein
MRADMAAHKVKNDAAQAGSGPGVVDFSWRTGPGVDFTDGSWIAMSMGQFIQILVDSGPKGTDAILFRVVSDTPIDGTSFMRQMDVLQVPSGAVAEQIAEHNAYVHKVLAGFLKAGLIE